MVDKELGQLERVELREVWQNEAMHFTPWLAQETNLRLLGTTLGMNLELIQEEKAVGRFTADILCKDVDDDDSLVLIENQLERTDHSHLGQILTYTAGLDAATMIWIAPLFTDEHRAALDWLNEHTDEQVSFFGLEVELWRIGDSPAAPKFNIVVKPNDWSRDVRAGARRAGLSEHRALQLEFWTAFCEYMKSNSALPCRAPRPEHAMDFTIGRSGFHLSTIATVWDTELQSDNPHVRVELSIDGSDAARQFAELERQKAQIEQEIGEPLGWLGSEDRKCRIYLKWNANIEDRGKWPEMHAWLKEHLELFQKVFAPRVLALDASHSELGTSTN